MHNICESQGIGSKPPNNIATEQPSLHASRPGKARTAILLWLIGVPIPLIVVFFLIRSCVGG